MKNTLRLIGPALMIFIGLQLLGNVVITFLLFYSWLFAVPLFDRSFSKKRFQINRQTAFIGIGSGLLIFTIIFGGLQWLHIYLLDINQLRVLLLEWGFSGPGEIGLMLILLILNPIAEEIYWRGYMFEKLKEHGSAFYTVWMTSIFYAFYHLLTVFPIFQGIFGIVAVLPVLIGGLIWGFMREKTGSVTATIISHGLADLGIVCVYWFIIR
ncbi:MAG TPA: type II CAAX endopeptidase family protein [Planococcus sp. (in: firmicutes)]|nr:type II CAAX endopeptidase family protein [Planococcus sp. (in: firmicutes)]